MSDNQSGDRQSWVADALSRHEAALIRYAVRLCGDEDIARDAVQETFLHMCAEDPAKLDGRLTPWLYTVCRNRVLDQKRKQRRERPAGELIDPSTPLEPSRRLRSTSESTDVAQSESDPSRVALKREGTAQVLSMLDDLPANQQNVIRLRFQSGLSYKEIAEITELTVTNVGFLIHAAIKTIRERMTTSREL